MSKITLNKMSYAYTDFYYPVYENISLSINTEWRLGLIGRNGRGKTTLLKLLKGELEPTAGKISRSIEMEYFPYERDRKYSLTMDMIKENVGQLKTMEDTMEAIINQNDENRFEEYMQIQEVYLARDGYEIESQILKEMDEMKLDQTLLGRPFETLSGGEKTRIMLLTLFLRKKRFILLDEPTNHLDTEGKEAVAEYLKKKKGFIIVSHDRVFLDRVIDHVLAINKKDMTIEKGNYSSWKHNKDKKEQYELRAKERLEQEIAQLERSAKNNRNWAAIGNTQKYQFASNGRANGVQAYMKQAKRSEARVEENILRKKQLLQNYEEVKPLMLSQREIEEEKCLVKINQLNFRYENAKKPVIQNFDLEVHTGERIWLKGHNGAGKSTLLRLLSSKIPHPSFVFIEGIKIAVVEQEPLWQTGYAHNWFGGEKESTRYKKFLALCDCFELPEDFLERPIETYSSGELKKINIAKVLSEENHLILFDEPLNYMDMYFSEQLEQAILNYQPTLIFVEHDGWFGQTIATQVIEM